MVSQYGSSAGLSFAADLLNAYNQRDYNLINTQMDPIMQVAGAMNPLVGQLQARAELEQARYNTISSAYNPTAPTPGYTTPSVSYNYANPLLNAAGQIYSLPQQSGSAVSLLAAQTQTMLSVPIKPSVLAVAVAVPLPPASPEVATPVAPSPAPLPKKLQPPVGLINPLKTLVSNVLPGFTPVTTNVNIAVKNAPKVTIIRMPTATAARPTTTTAMDTPSQDVKNKPKLCPHKTGPAKETGPV